MAAFQRLLAVFVLIGASALFADGPADNIPDKVRPIPPEGIKIADLDRAELMAGVAALEQEIIDLGHSLAKKPALLELLPDVQIFHNAVRYALRYNEFYDLKEVAVAHKFLAQGMERATALREGKSPWTSQTGLVVRGYVSKIDGSVQPYGLVVPAVYRPDEPGKYRLDVWCHGRGEKLTELSFLNGRQNSPGEFVPAHAFVLHLYGRYCCANKFAGEIDCLEALAHVEKHYPIDENRRVIRGFSMGGAACWQFAVHYPSLWCAAAPGAGFSETADFLKVFQDEQVKPPDYEQKLWHMYDCTDYAANLFNVPTVAYSGEKDKQKQAADMMARAMKEEKLTLVHLIGPGTGHSYHPETKNELNRRIDRIAERGREPAPNRVRFTTYTLRYDRSFWVRVDGLERHWERADVDATAGSDAVEIHTKNVTALTLEMDAGDCPLDPTDKPKVTIDDDELEGAPVLSDKSWKAHFRKTRDGWQAVDKPDETGLTKHHGLQGPIDDAFMDSFLIAKPTGKPMHEQTGAWVNAEMKRAIEHWRKQFRGEARVKPDDEVTPEDIAQHNLILWGDPSSNQVLAKVAEKLPVKWDQGNVLANRDTFAADSHMPVLIYPNPLNPKRYVVLNSGFTFRDYDYLNNARQVPKLPDYAVIDVRTPPSSRWPGKVVKAGFFDEKWGFPVAER
jgi:pimeloyl-ACP methyl ester carboxylesterase